jgi:hypothetical protein
MTAFRRPRGRHLALLIGSIICSLASLAALVIRPESTGSLRTSLNVIALALVIITATMLARDPGGRDG